MCETYENTEWVTPPDEYECSLSEETRKVAEDQLRENEQIRDQALESMRTWILQNPRIVKCRLDSNFLLRFLRTKKFSVVQAQEALERYILLRQTWGEGYSQFDCNLPKMQKLLDLGFMFPCPKRDNMGRKLIVFRMGVFDTTKFIDKDVIRMWNLAHETLMEDEENQVRGYSYFVDVKGMSMSFIAMFNAREFTRILKNGEKIIPMRFKKAHVINLPSYLKITADFVISFLAEKFRKRISIYDSEEMAYEHGLERNILPKEYGGDIPMAEMIALWKEELKKMNKLVLLNDNIRVREEYYSAKARAGAVSALKQSLNQIACGDDENLWNITGNFRKLEVD